MTMTLGQLPVGSAFRCAGTGRAGRLVRRSPGAAVVAWGDRPTTRTISAHDAAGAPVERTIRVAPATEYVSLGTEVEPQPETGPAQAVKQARPGARPPQAGAGDGSGV